MWEVTGWLIYSPYFTVNRGPQSPRSVGAHHCAPLPSVLPSPSWSEIQRHKLTAPREHKNTLKGKEERKQWTERFWVWGWRTAVPADGTMSLSAQHWPTPGPTCQRASLRSRKCNLWENPVQVLRAITLQAGTERRVTKLLWKHLFYDTAESVKWLQCISWC